MNAEHRDLMASMSTFDIENVKDEDQRLQLKDAAKALLRRIETPFEMIWDHVWSYPALAAALKVSSNLKLFEKWLGDGGEARTAEQLAAMVNVKPNFLARFLRHMAALQLLEEVGEQAYSMTRLAKAFGEPRTRDMWHFQYLVLYPGMLNLPLFLTENNYSLPDDSHNTNWTHLMGNGETFFDTMSKPQNRDVFQNGMAVMSQNKPTTSTIYPVTVLLQQWNRDRPFVVDVGGGSGHDLQHFKHALPDMPDGSLLLQDLPEIITQANTPPPMAKMAYDFFTPQPIKGARIYHLHMILHDWPDSQALTILSNLASAMERGYSKILILDAVVSAQSPHPMATAHDLTMMMIASAKERTEKDWLKLIEASGLKLVKIWKSTGPESVLELELP